MVEFQVRKMSCGGCASRVTKVIHGVDSTAKVDIDLKSKMARVETKVDLDTLTSALAEAGYPTLSE
ncbi:heavy-metal-associated domain-containing protein [Herbaspirillum sp. ST 5-3]|uniref:heavy-metal-associated domain-containing protein n=1 Tax=Oxalobacteraceae TaxID=75682 RepID=UPI0010A3F7F9|nr:heavy-metal-associated domain-containing protein [Herbaspirillum sp. ST 5-3]